MGLEEKYSQFKGTEYHYKHSSKMLYTDGIQYVADQHQAFWLIDTIGSYQSKLINEGFQVWCLNVKDSKATLICKRDSDGPVLVRQRIEYTDFPESIRVWVVNGTLMLPSEY